MHTIKSQNLQKHTMSSIKELNIETKDTKQKNDAENKYSNMTATGTNYQKREDFESPFDTSTADGPLTPGVRLASILSASKIRGVATSDKQDLSWYSPIAIASKSPSNLLAQLISLNVLTPNNNVRKTGIICTIGPKTNTPEMMAKLRLAGMNVVRLNFSHGSYEYHKSVITNLRKSYEIVDGPIVAVALDTKGPEIRTGLTKNNAEIHLKKDHRFILTTDEKYYEDGDENHIYVDYKNQCSVIKTGSTIYIDDGLLKQQVESIDVETKSLTTIILNNATISSNKGVNLPGTSVDLPTLSEKDKKDLLWGIENHVNFIFASFIRSGDAVREIRKVLGEHSKKIQIISKVENQQGIENIDSIIQESDGIMVARGDLGIEIPVEKVFVAQKMMIAKCNILGKPVICATQMLESMTNNPRPTRAEVSDVANAVLDGADCVMLSGETAKGAYPVETVKMMHTICKEAEAAIPNKQHYMNMLDIHPISYIASETLAGSAVNAAFTQKLKAIIVYSVSGRTARLVSKYRPNCPIICVTSDPTVACSSQVCI